MKMKRKLYVTIINLGKAFDKINRNNLIRILEEKSLTNAQWSQLKRLMKRKKWRLSHGEKDG